MKNLSVCLLLLFVAGTAAVAALKPKPEVTVFSDTQTIKAYFTVAVKVTSVTGTDTVKINDETAIAAENDEFYATLKLDHGPNAITVTAVAKNGAQTQKKFTLHRRSAKDTEAPTIAITNVGNTSIRSTDDGILVSEEKIVIRGSVTDPSGVYNDSVYVNDEKVTLAFNGTFETNLFLNYGMNPIAVKAIDKEKNVSQRAFTIYQRPDRDGKDFALLFATDDYSGEKDKNGNWQNLPSTIRDAEAVAENLRDNYGFETKVFKNLTKRELLNTLYTYRNDFDGTEYAPDSQLLIFFTGHGYYDAAEMEGYLITADTEGLTVDPTLASALSHTKLRDQIDSSKCPRILVMLDTGFSGTFDPSFAPTPVPVLRGLFDEMSLLKRIKMMLSLDARWYLTAAGDQYIADGMTGGSPFTNAFLNALNTIGGEDLLLDLNEVWEAIQKSKDDPIYDLIIEHMKTPGQNFERPAPRKGQFGKSSHAESSFLFFPLPEVVLAPPVDDSKPMQLR